MSCEDFVYRVASDLYYNGYCNSIEEGCESIKKHTGFGVESAIDTNYKRLSWDSYFMSLAFLVALRSPDSQTQHGAVIVGQDNAIISTGYNGFLPGVEDVCMPNTRPLKYQHVIHAEVNAILSAARDLRGCKIYITGMPCNECLKVIAKTGIKHVIVGDRTHVLAAGYFEMQTLICTMHEITIEKFVGNLAHLEGRKLQ